MNTIEKRMLSALQSMTEHSNLTAEKIGPSSEAMSHASDAAHSLSLKILLRKLERIEKRQALHKKTPTGTGYNGY